MAVVDSRWGGTTSRALATCEAIRGLGGACIIVAPRTPGVFADRARERGFEVLQTLLYPPSASSFWRNIRWVVTFWPAVLLLARTIARAQVNIVTVNGFLVLQPAIAAFILRRRIVWMFGGLMYPRWLVRLLMPLIERMADRLVFEGESVRHFYLGDAPRSRALEKTRILGGRVDLSRFDPTRFSSEDRDALRSALGISPEATLAGAVGNVNPLKGYEVLVDAAAIVAERDPDIHFLVAGAILSTQQSYFAEVTARARKAGVEQCFRFLGERDDIPELLHAMDIYVLSSWTEGIPNALEEAMAIGLPVVSTNVGSVPDLVTDGESGLLVDPGDAAGMAAAIQTLLNDPHLASRLGAEARAQILAQPSGGRGVSYAEIFQELA